MRIASALLVGVLAIGEAHFARECAGRSAKEIDEPFAPSPTSAPIVSLGYREAAADLLFIRLAGYFGSLQANADTVASLVEAVVALDPHVHRIYEYGTMSMIYASQGVTQDTYQRALRVLEQGATEFPDDWKIPSLAGEIYTQDLQTKDPAQRRAWDEKGVLLTESAIRKPGAPAVAATWAATMRTKLGQHDRAVRNLREMILITSDDDSRKRLLDKLAQLEDADANALEIEMIDERRKFDSKWRRDRPMISPSMYVLLGPRRTPGFDLTDLATGGADLVGSEPVDKLEPLGD